MNHEMAHYLRNQSRVLGQGFLYGKLYNVGNYPGLKLGGDGKVFGDVLELTSPSESLRKLDIYEGIGMEIDQPFEYSRLVANVFFEQQQIECWTYRYNFPVDETDLIVSGDYLEFFKQKFSP